MRDELSPHAVAGGKTLMAYFIDAARAADRHFAGGPVWNHADRLIPGHTQSLRYTFDDLIPKVVSFSTAELEEYGVGDTQTSLTLEKKVYSLLA